MDEKSKDYSNFRNIHENNIRAQMSYSMMVDNNIHKDPLTTAMPRKMHSWIDDDNANACYKCRTPFTILTRRHHCRLCGRIYCYRCCNCVQYIPSILSLSNSKKNVWHYVESFFYL